MKNKPILYFRANGSLTIGYGHVIRSLALAEILKKKFDCRFIIHEPDGFLKAQILTVCNKLIEIPSFPSLSDEAVYISSQLCTPDDFVVLDGYLFSGNYQRIIKQGCSKLISIDDVPKEYFYSDVIINHGEGIKENNYKKEWYSKVYSGSKYAILRSPFYKLKKSPIRNRVKNPSVFINLGGTDPLNYTLKALKEALQIRNVTSINIVIGEQYPFKEELLRIIGLNKDVNIKLHINVGAERMASLMASSSIGICAASSVSYEYATVGGLMFVYKTADNQKNIYSFLVREKIAFPVSKLKDRIKLISSQALFEKYCKHKKLFFSGNSSDNLVQVFDKLMMDSEISIRKASIKDLKTYYYWVNEKDVRKNSVNQEPIPLESHKTWFKSRLNSESSFLYVFSHGKRKIGQVRIEISDKNIAEIDFSIDKKMRGRCYSEIILRKAIFMFKSGFGKTVSIGATVKINNIPSWKVFVSNGFLNKGIVKIKGESYYKFLLK